jgi:hypothetical protein
MAIQTSIKKSFIYWNLLYLVLCGGLGAWGAYDYWVTIPEREEAVERYGELMGEFASLELRGQYEQLAAKRAQNALTEDERTALKELEQTLRDAGMTSAPPPLSDADKERYSEIKQILTVDFENTQPEPPASYDRWVNLWVYVVGTGILGTPYFVWRLISRRGQTWRLEDDGSLSTPEGTYPADAIEGIDMSVWMKKSIAKVHVRDRAEPVVLDDYEYQDAYRIIGTLAHQFHPDEWTEDAKPVKEPMAESTAETEGDDRDLDLGSSDAQNHAEDDARA